MVLGEDLDMKKILILIALAVAAMACSKEENAVSGGTTEIVNGYPVIKASIQNTKTTLTDNGDYTYTMNFALNDEIAVFNGVKDATTHLPCRYKCTAVGATEATFSYSPNESSDDLSITPDGDIATVIATYPYRSPSTGAYVDENRVQIRMVATGNTSSTEVGFVKTSMPLIASAANGSTLSFKQTVGMLELTLKGTATISSIKMTSDQNISGAATVSYTSAKPELSVTDAGKSITLTYGGIVLNESTGCKFYFGLPVGTHNLTFLITDSEGNTQTLTTPSVLITRSDVRRATLTYSHDPLSNVENLSSFGHFANCYVVSSAGNYCFNAYKPDGSLVSGSNATWVWAAGEACNGASDLPPEMMTDVSYSNGKVFFTVPSSYTVGNVVLGIVNGSNDLLYTWHIWLTSDDIDDITSNGITIMDRNLGAGAEYDVSVATNAPLQTGKGCFYQWGRKDPILGARNSASGAESTAFGTTSGQYSVINTSASITNVSAWGLDAFDTFTVEAGAAKPVTMGNSATAKPGYISGNTDAWSVRTNANPCPYGYRPATSSEFTTLKDAGYSNENYNNFGQITLGGVKFARAGYRGGTDGKAKEGQSKSGSAGTARYWADDAASASQGYLMKITWATAQTDGVYPLADSWWSLAGFNANHACSVRCVKQ